MKFNSIRGANVPSVLSHAIVYNERPGRNPLIRPAPADESAFAGHPPPRADHIPHLRLDTGGKWHRGTETLASTLLCPARAR
jgi:hypothetical protein